MKNNTYNNFFMNFSNRTKLAIILCLKEKPLSVNEIVERIGEEQSNTSHNLKQLTKCKILNVKQQGKKRIYSLNKKTALPLLELVEKHVGVNCAGNCSGCLGCH